MAPPPSLEVAVIGAGVAGLAAARAVKAEGLQVTVYEKSDQLGGTWVYDPRLESDPLGLDPDREIVHSSMYPSLQTNLPRQLMGFSDYPFGSRKNGDSRTFPGHQEVLTFIREFAEYFGLVELIRLNTEVVRVERAGSKWLVQSRTTNSDPGSEEEMFDAVMVCNGHYTQPRLAQIPGLEKWPGMQIHSHSYKSPEPFQDKVVVMIGNGPSAIDISVEISTVAKEVHLSSRGPNIKISKLDFADNMWQHSKVDCVDENGVVSFQDGACLHADIILHCTGYDYTFPFLKTDGIVHVDDNCVGPLYKHIFPPKLAPSLSFIGLTSKALAVFLKLDLQAKWVAQVLSGKANLPSEEEMQADVKWHYKLMEANGVPKHLTHSLGLNIEIFYEYLDWIASQAGLGQVDEEIKETTKNFFSFVKENGFGRCRHWEPDRGA